MQEISRSPATTSRSNDPASRPSSRCAHDSSLSVVSSATGGTGPSTSGWFSSAIARARSSISTGDRPAKACPINIASVSTANSDPSGDRVRVQVRAEPDVLVDVTPAAVAELALRPGLDVWVSVKATELDVYPEP